MPEKLMELIEQLKEESMKTKSVWYTVNFWDNGTFDVFIPSSKELPSGTDISFKWLESIKRWEKTVVVNGIPYSSLVSDEEVSK